MSSFSNIMNAVRDSASRNPRSNAQRALIPNASTAGAAKTGSITVPPGQRWRILSLVTAANTSATVGNREWEVVVNSNGVRIFLLRFTLAITPNLTGAVLGASVSIGAEIQQMPVQYRPLPQLVLLGGDTITFYITLPTARDANDIANYYVHYEEV